MQVQYHFVYGVVKRSCCFLFANCNVYYSNFKEERPHSSTLLSWELKGQRMTLLLWGISRDTRVYWLRFSKLQSFYTYFWRVLVSIVTFADKIWSLCLNDAQFHYLLFLPPRLSCHLSVTLTHSIVEEHPASFFSARLNSVILMTRLLNLKWLATVCPVNHWSWCCFHSSEPNSQICFTKAFEIPTGDRPFYCKSYTFALF